MRKDGFMKNLFKPEMLKVLIAILTFLLIFKLLWLIIQIGWLSPLDIDQAEDKSSKSLYYRVKLTPNNIAAPQHVPAISTTRIEGSIKEIKLLAIYNASDIAVVTVEYRKKTKVLGSGDVINGFTLAGAGRNFAMFSKNEKNYKVLLAKNSKISSNVSSIKSISSIKKEKGKKVLGEVTNEGDAKIIDRSLLEYYANNMNEIYKNIGIAEIKEGKNLKGFKINFVRKDSPFSKLGIRRNDVIKSINGQEITSYNAAFGVYKNIKDVDNLNMVIMRGKEEMELEYEIN